MGKLDPTRLYQSNSAEGRGVSSHGPYYWRAPRFFYPLNESFKTETGSVSVPTHRINPGNDAAERLGDD